MNYMNSLFPLKAEWFSYFHPGSEKGKNYSEHFVNLSNYFTLRFFNSSVVYLDVSQSWNVSFTLWAISLARFSAMPLCVGRVISLLAILDAPGVEISCSRR